MEKSWKLRAAFVLILLITALVSLIPSMLDSEEHEWVSNINEGISLGLDLKGGIHFVLNVDVEKALRDRIDRMTDEIRIYLEDEEIPFRKISADASRRMIIIKGGDSETEKPIDETVTGYFRSLRKESESEGTYRFIMLDDSVDFIKERAVDQAVETLRTRIDELGLREPLVAQQGATSILIQLPGYKDIERARSIIGQTAQLEFKIVADDRNPLGDISEDIPDGVTMENERVQMKDGSVNINRYAVSSDRRKLESFLEGKAPEGTAFHLERTEMMNGEVEYRTFLLEDRSYLTGDMLTDARVNIDQQKNKPYVSIKFDRNGARIFEEITGKFTKRRMAIVLDDFVKSAPVIQDKIAGGNAMITLSSMQDFNTLLSDAKDLALVLRAGSLPAPVTFEENRTVGPSLGADSIRNGKISVIVGFLLVILFMILYYRWSGFVANIALVLNLVFILAIMAVLGATLTFPGIAGIVLTVGMAVDANVIIFERIREERKAGRRITDAIDTGYSKAWSAILDANITTGIAAFILWNFGSGPIKGFAITLLLGIISSMFTAIFVTRIIFHYLRKAGLKDLSF
ncbi:MAG: protein translocase subunit SecD [bacterium]